MTPSPTTFAASVIIPCYHCADAVGVQLDALARQSFDRPFEVILADNGDDGRLPGVVEEYRERLPHLRIVPARDERGAAHARNVGAAHARSDVFLFADADDEVGDGWLAAMVAALERHPFVGCRMDFEKLNPEGTAARQTLQQHGLQQYTYPAFLPHAAGGTLGIRREAHEAVGGFNTEMFKLQDTDYCWRVQLAGYEMAFVPDAVIHYRLRETLKDTVRQAFYYGEYNVKLYSMYRRQGMGKITLWSGLRAWYYLARQLPSLLRPETRTKFVWSLVWRFGRLYGSLRYRVFAI